jgi:hypothetical protein
MINYNLIYKEICTETGYYIKQAKIKGIMDILEIEFESAFDKKGYDKYEELIIQ